MGLDPIASSALDAEDYSASAVALLNRAVELARRDRCAVVDPGHLVVGAAQLDGPIGDFELELTRIDPMDLRRSARKRWGLLEQGQDPKLSAALIVAVADATRAAGGPVTDVDLLRAIVFSPAVDFPEMNEGRLRLMRVIEAHQEQAGLGLTRLGALLVRHDLSARLRLRTKGLRARVHLLQPLWSLLGSAWFVIQRMLDAGLFVALAPGIGIRETVRSALAALHGSRRRGHGIIDGFGYDFALQPTLPGATTARIHLWTSLATMTIGVLALLPVATRSLATGAPLLAGIDPSEILSADDTAIVAGTAIASGGGDLTFNGWIALACFLSAVPPLEHVKQIIYGRRIDNPRRRRGGLLLVPYRVAAWFGRPLDRVGEVLQRNAVFGTGLFALVFGVAATRAVSSVLL